MMVRKRKRVAREKYERFPSAVEQAAQLRQAAKDLPLPSAQPRNETNQIVQELLGETDVDPAMKVDGMPPNYGKDVLPHVISFTGLISTISKVYRPSDNALQASWENARYMLNDCSVMECLEQRMRSTALLNWHLEPEDETDPKQKKLAEDLTAIIEQTPRFMQYRESLLRALWFGKYACKMRYRWKTVQGKQRICVDKWEPVHGDKLVFRYDSGTGDYDPDQVGIRVGAGFHSLMARSWQQERLSQIQLADIGLAYFLRPWERQLLAIHKHCTEDGEWEDVESAGRIHGVGIRHRIYWAWYQMQEALAWLMEFLERSAFGMEIWYYPWGDKTARDQMYTAAQDRIGQGRNIILVPRPVGEASQAYGVERIEPAMAGAEILAEKVIKELFGHRIKRYILGQTLTSESSGTGLGSNLASVHLDTYLQIVRYDATNLEESMTTELVTPLKQFNFPSARDLPVRFKIDTEAQDVDGKLAAWERAWNMGCRLKESDVMELIAASAPTEEDVALVNPTIDQQKRLTMMHEQQMQMQQQQAAAGSTPAQPQGPQPPPAEAVDPNQPFQPGQAEQYKQNAASLHGGGWKTVGGGAHAFIGANGQILAACPGMKGEDVDDIIDEPDASRDEREHRQKVAKSKGIEGDEISIGGLTELEKSPPLPERNSAPIGSQKVKINNRDYFVSKHRETWMWTVDPSLGWTQASGAMATAIEKASGGSGQAEVKVEGQAQANKAREAQRRQKAGMDARHAARQQRTQDLVDTAKEWGLSPDDLNDAIDYLLEEKQTDIRNREAAKARARQLTGLTAGDIGRLENAGHDYASGIKAGGRAGEILRHWDEYAQEIATEHPDLGWGDSVNTSQALWDLIREGARHVPSRHDPEVLQQAAHLALAHRGDAGGAQEFDTAGSVGQEAWDPESVPFSKRGMVEKYARWLYAKRKSAAGQSSMFKESEHPRDDSSGEFVEKGGGESKKADAPKSDSLPGQRDLFGGETAKGTPPPKLVDIPPPAKKATKESMFHGQGDMAGQGDLFSMDYKDEAPSKSVSIGGEDYPAVEANKLKPGMTYWDGSEITAVSPKGESSTILTLKTSDGTSVDRTVRNSSLIGLQGDVAAKEPTGLVKPKADPVDDSPEKLKEDAKLFKRATDLKNRLVDLKVALTDGKITKAHFHSQHAALKPQLDNVMEAIGRVQSRDKLPGGPADNMPDSAFDPKQLATGRKEESEHTDVPEVAGEIAKDHLVTGKKYAADEGPPSHGIGGVATTADLKHDPDFSPEDLAGLDGVLEKKSGTANLTDRRNGDVYRYTASEGGVSVERSRSNWSTSDMATPEAQRELVYLFRLGFREQGWCCPNYPQTT